MSVKIHIHPYLKYLADNRDFVMVEGTTIGECLEEVVKKYPKLEEYIFTKEHTSNPMFEVYLNMESTLPDGLAIPVAAGDEINLIITIAGG